MCVCVKAATLSKKSVSPSGEQTFEIVVGVLQGHTLIPPLFIICLDYVIRMLIDLMKENVFTLKKARSR